MTIDAEWRVRQRQELEQRRKVVIDAIGSNNVYALVLQLCRARLMYEDSVDLDELELSVYQERCTYTAALDMLSEELPLDSDTIYPDLTKRAVELQNGVLCYVQPWTVPIIRTHACRLACRQRSNRYELYFSTQLWKLSDTNINYESFYPGQQTIMLDFSKDQLRRYWEALVTNTLTSELLTDMVMNPPEPWIYCGQDLLTFDSGSKFYELMVKEDNQ